VFAGVGAGNIFQRGTCCLPVILGGYASGATASSEYANRDARHQRRRPHASHAYSQIVGLRLSGGRGCDFRQSKHGLLMEN
jgi:hypothetical protein